MIDTSPPATSKINLTRSTLIAFMFIFFMYIGSLLLTFIPTLAHTKLGDTYTLRDAILIPLAVLLKTNSLYLMLSSVYARTWESEPLRWWKIALGIGGILTLGSCLNLFITTIQLNHSQSDEDVVVIIVWMCAGLIGAGLVLTGFINLNWVSRSLKRVARSAKQGQEELPSENT